MVGGSNLEGDDKKGVGWWGNDVDASRRNNGHRHSRECPCRTRDQCHTSSLSTHDGTHDGTQDPHVQRLVRPSSAGLPSTGASKLEIRAQLHSRRRASSADTRGLAIISKNRAPRLAALGAILARGEYDIVCLQELWVHSEFESLRQDIEGAYPHSRFFHT